MIEEISSTLITIINSELNTPLTRLTDILQLGIAFSLAYLNLERFRYSHQATKKAENILLKISNTKGTLKDYAEEMEFRNFSDLLTKKLEISTLDFLKKIWNSKISILTIYFYFNIDRLLVFFISLLLGWLLIVSTNFWFVLDYYKLYNDFPTLLFIATLVLSIFPILNVFFGQLMSNHLFKLACKHQQNIDKVIEHLAIFSKGELQKVLPLGKEGNDEKI